LRVSAGAQATGAEAMLTWPGSRAPKMGDGVTAVRPISHTDGSVDRQFPGRGKVRGDPDDRSR
jgi:hypothetical protein